MITLQELCYKLNGLLLRPEITDYCPNGLQVEGKEKISKVVTGVSASFSTIEAAVKANADALIVHHGMFWKGDSYVVNGAKKRKLALLIESGISLLAYHLPLDAHEEYGNNWKAAKEMGWQNLEPFGIFNGVPIGVKGTFSPVSREAFQQLLEKYYDHPANSALGGKEQVSTVGLVSGGAYRSIEEAAKEGLDCFVTGNYDEPAWHMAHEMGVNFFPLGHSATERVGPRALGEWLKETTGVAVEFVDIPNPF